MKNKKRIARILALVIAFLMIFFSLANMAFAEEEKDITYVDEQLDFLKDLVKYVDAKYADDIDYEKIVDEVYNGFFEALDPYSTYFTRNDEYDDFVESVSGEYTGIGVVITTKDNQCVVISAMADGPSYEAGILSGDVIVSVDGEDVSEATSEYIVSLLRGEPGTKVTVGIKREGYAENLQFEIIRETIKLSSVSHEVKENHIGYIRIVSFDSNTGEEFKDALAKLREENIQSLIIDLRNNGGGYINTALEVAEAIVPKGPIMHFESKGEITETYESETPQIDIPVAVLVNGGTASASEIMAGAIQDSNSGTIIGTQTFGKGSAQTSLNLKNGGGMKLTVAHFLTPNKNVIHQNGITPDIVIENKANPDFDELVEQAEQFAPMIESQKPTLNDQGLNVFGAQQRLAFLGYDQVRVTGILDEVTFEAIKHFQTAKGIFPYGVLDHTTRDLLETEIVDYLNNLNRDAQLEKAIEILK